MGFTAVQPAEATGFFALFRGQSGSYLYPSGQSTTLAATADQLRISPILVVQAITADRITCEVTTAVAATTVRLGIYQDSASRPGYPGALLLDAGTVDSSTTGVKEITISQVLTPGLYWLGGAAVGGTPTLRAVNEPYVSLGYGENNSSTAKRAYVQAGVSGALPATYTTTVTTGGTAFRVLLRQA